MVVWLMRKAINYVTGNLTIINIRTVSHLIVCLHDILLCQSDILCEQFLQVSPTKY